MKKIDFILTALMGAVLMGIAIGSCKNDEATDSAEYELMLTAPADGNPVDLSQDATVRFGFNEAPNENMYVLMLSRQEDMTEPQSILVTDNPQPLTTAELDAKRKALGIPSGQTTALYWSVRPNSGAYNIKTQVRSLQLTVPWIAVTGVTVSPATLGIGIGDSFAPTVTVQPADASNKTFIWSSNNTGVATVNNSGLITGVTLGTGTITVTTEDGGYTATVAVTVERPAAESAAELATTLGANATRTGATVTLTDNVSVETVTVSGGVTLVVPDGITLTVTGALNGAGTLDVSGVVNVGADNFTGAVNLQSGGATNVGFTDTTISAASGLVWKFGDSDILWSDLIQLPECEDQPFAANSTSPQCGTYTTADNTKHFAYNWYYVVANESALCPAPWRVPSKADADALVLAVQSRVFLTSRWGLGGQINTGGNVDMGSDAMLYWTSTEANDSEAWDLTATTWDMFTTNPNNKLIGKQVRCVRDIE